MPERILIMAASVGSGHVKAGEALAAAFRQFPQVEEVVCDDALEYTNAVHKQFYSGLYKTLSSLAPNFLGWWYESSDDPWLHDQVLLALDLPHVLPLVKYIKDFRPTAIVCTHFMPAGVVSFLLRQKLLDTRLYIIITDFHFHGEWVTRAFTRYFVPSEEEFVHGTGLGLPPERVSVTGIPIDPEFQKPVDRTAVLEKLGFNPNIPTLLLSAGALGLSPATSVARRLLTLDNEVQIIAVCGRNTNLMSEIQQLAAPAKHPFAVLGYTSEMRELMGASTLLLSKPGGMTTSEALACGLPMVILDPIGGQEERNAERLLESGAAVKCSEVTLIRYKLDRLLGDPDRIARMARNARALGKPDSAREIAATILGERELPLVTFSRQDAARFRRTLEA